MFAVSFQGGWSLDTLRHTNIAMDNGPFDEDVFRIESENVHNPMLLLMEEILHHLGWLNPMNNGIIIILGGAGFCPSIVCYFARW